MFRHRSIRCTCELNSRSLNDIEYLVISSNLLNTIENIENLSAYKGLDNNEHKTLTLLMNELNSAGKLIIQECNDAYCSRTNFEESILNQFLKLNVEGAKAVKSEFKPKPLI